MRPCTSAPLVVRDAAFGGTRPLICVPLVGRTLEDLLAEAEVAVAAAPDVVEWRADFYDEMTPESLVRVARELRQVVTSPPIIFTLRIEEEGGARSLEADARWRIMAAVLESGCVDLLDVELRNGPEFLGPIVDLAHQRGVRVILSFHDFKATPSPDVLGDTIARMVQAGADIAKVACMPVDSRDVLRLLEATVAARARFPDLPLITMSMGQLGLPTRVAGFLFGSDMSFAVGQTASAPGQIPVGELRALVDGLLRYA